jgi:hypothetical protein
MQSLVAAWELQELGIAVVKLPRPSKLVHALRSLLSGVAYWQGLFGQVQNAASSPSIPSRAALRVRVPCLRCLCFAPYRKSAIITYNVSRQA